jgi:hypothetical protein
MEWAAVCVGMCACVVATGCSDRAEGDAADSGAADAESVPSVVELTTYLDQEIAPMPWVVFQDGEGPWTPLVSADGHYSFDVTNHRYGVLGRCEDDGTVRLSLLYATVAEGAAVTLGCFTGARPLGMLDITVDGIAPGRSVFLWSGTSVDTVTADAPTARFSAPPGTRDVGINESDDQGVTRFAALRGVFIEEGTTTTAEIDLDAVGFAPEIHDVRIEGENSPGGATASVVLETPDLGVLGGGAAVDGRYAAVPLAHVGSDDLFKARASEVISDGGGTHSVATFFTSPADVDLHLPPLLDPAELTVVAPEPYLRLETRFLAYPEATIYRCYVYEATGSRSIDWRATPGWLGDGASLSVAFPDLSGVDGWDDSWAVRLRTDVVGFLAVQSGSFGPFDFSSQLVFSFPGRQQSRDWAGKRLLESSTPLDLQ